jgi:amidohydrolase
VSQPRRRAALALLLVVVAPWLAPRLAAAAADPEVEALVARHLPATIADRRWLHEHPELSGREHGTRRYVERQVAAIPGVQPVSGDWGLGLVYVLPGARPGPTVLWRADMDGLPLDEDTGLPFASTVTDTLAGGRVTGVMHACGHDIHMSVALGAMRVLADLRERWPGRLVFVFQPAEETGDGARALIEAGVLEGDLRPDWVFALHDHPTLLAGQAGVKAGPATANVDGFRLTVHGTGGHGAYPHRTVDPVSLACRMVLAVNDIVAREVDPNHPAVVSFGMIQGGAKANVIPDRVELAATVRTRDAATRALIEQKIERTVRGLAVAAGAPEPDFEFYLGTPAGYNDPVVASQLMAVFRRVLGPDNAIDYPAGMGGEDFGRFSSVIPGAQFRLGVGRPERAMSLHAPTFDPDEGAVAVGMQVVVEVLLDQLGR